MDEKRMSNIVEQYSRPGTENVGEIKITRVPDWKSVFIETIGDNRTGGHDDRIQGGWENLLGWL